MYFITSTGFCVFRLIPKQLLVTASALILCISSLAFCDDAPTHTPTAAPATILPDQALHSPRSTVSTFLTAMDPSDGKIEIDQAIKTLDLADIPELVRSERAEEVAVKLYAILDHVGFTSGKAPSSSTVDAIQIMDVAGYGIYLERSGPNWRFSRTTVTDVPTIFREVESKLSTKDMRVLADASNTWLTVRTYVPEALKNRTILIEDWQWVAGLLAAFLLFLIHKAVLHTCRWIITAALAPRLGLPPHLSVQPLGKPVGIIVLTTALQLFLCTIDLPISVYSTIVAWLATVRILALSILGIHLVEILGERLTFKASRSRSSIDDILYPLVQKALWVIVVLAGTAQILSVHGVNVSGLVAGLGLGGLAFALAAKDTIENIFGSVAILIDQPFRVGDAIDVGGVSGTVEQIGLRSTRLRTPDNSLVSMPNSKVIAGHVDNLGVRPYARTRIILNIGYDTAPEVIEAVCGGIQRLLLSHPRCKRDSISVFLHEFNQSSLGLLVQFHLQVKDWNEEQEIKDQIFRAIIALLSKLNVRLSPSPLEVRMSQAQLEPAPETSANLTDTALSAADELALPWKKSATTKY